MGSLRKTNKIDNFSGHLREDKKKENTVHDVGNEKDRKERKY